MARGNGEGSVYQRKDTKRWVGAVSLPHGQGRITASFPTRAEAKAWVADRIAEARQTGRVVGKGGRVTCRDYLNYWTETVVKPSVKPSTHRIYRIHLGHIIPHIGQTLLSDIEPSGIQAAYTAILAEGNLSANSVLQLHTTLSMALRQAVAEHRIKHNPLAAVKPPAHVRVERRVYTASQLKALLDIAAGTKWCALWWVLGTAGLRISEALALEWRDFDPAAATLRIERAVRDAADLPGQTVTSCKTPASNRTVTLTASCVTALQHHRALHEGVQRLIFPGPRGVHMWPAPAVDRLRHDAERAGIPERTPHELRHTYATLALANGIPPHVVQKQLGHSSIRMTLDIYGHVIPSMQTTAAAQFDALLQSAGDAGRVVRMG